MGKEDKFINPQKAVIIKLGSRDLADPNRLRQKKSGPTYEIVSFPGDERLTEEEIKKRNKIIGLFDQTDQGKFDYSKVDNGTGIDHKSQALKLAEGQEGLWINTLQKMKQGSLQKEILAGGEYDDVEYEEEELDDVDEGEEYEFDEDEEFEYEEEEEEENEDSDQDQEEETKSGDLKGESKVNQKKKEQAVLEGKNQQKIFDDFKKTYIIEKQDGENVKKIVINPDKIYDIDDIDYSKIKINKNIKMKKLNKYGLPADDGYDYSQHVFQNNDEPEGELVAAFTNKQEFAPRLEPDYDYQPEEMTKEQQEVFESLNQNDIYEDLEDDFVALAQEGEDCIENLEDNYKEQTSKNKNKGSKKLKQKQQKIKTSVKQTQPIDELNCEDDENLEDGDIMGDEEFDEEEFKKAMELYEECEDEKKAAKKEKIEVIQGQELENILDSHLDDIKIREQKKKPQLAEEEIKKVQFEFYGSKADEEAYEEFADQKLDNDVPDIIRKMKERLDQLDLERNGEQKEKSKPLYMYNVKRRQKEEREIQREDKIALRKAEIEKYGDIVVDRQTVKPLMQSDDIALQNYLARTEEEEEKIQEEEDKRFEKNLQPRPLDVTIATKTFAQSRVHENLNVIAEMTKKEINKSMRQSLLLEQSKLEQASKLQNSAIQEDEDDDESEIGDGRVRDVSSIFQKRSKQETPEERKLRKELVKQFKKQRKEDKKSFKDNFENLTKAQSEKITKQAQNQNNLRGVGVQKL